MGIPVYEKAPDTEAFSRPILPRRPTKKPIEEAAAALAALDAELGRTTDPVRMYMREMGTVELLTREGEIRIAKRIEEGLDAVRRALSNYPPTCEFLLRAYEPVKAGQARAWSTSSSASSTRTRRTSSRSRRTRPRWIWHGAGAEEKTEGRRNRRRRRRGEEEEAVDTGPDPEEAARRFASIGKTSRISLTHSTRWARRTRRR